MSKFWQRHAQRIDALSLRERAILFITVALVIGALADTLVLTPSIAAQRALSGQLKHQSEELLVLRTQLHNATRPVAADTPEGHLRREIAKLQTQEQTLDAQLAQQLASSRDSARLPDLLERALKRRERVTLLQLVTANDAAAPRSAANPALNPALPSTPVPNLANANALANGMAALSTAMAASAVPGTAPPPAWQWQGVQFSLRGRYLDLSDALGELEQALPGLRWTEIELDANVAPPVLKLRVQLAGAAS